MATTIERATVLCPNCGTTYMDWRFVDPDPEVFGEEYLDQCRSALCPLCKTKVYFEMMVVKDGVFYMPEKK
ncbi:MAG: hypothetical protein NTV99_07910 [Deltaproteobacteria bacterium]|nr:hypothetical protein [Deltaproteobacteria bacterium]